MFGEYGLIVTLIVLQLVLANLCGDCQYFSLFNRLNKKTLNNYVLL